MKFEIIGLILFLEATNSLKKVAKFHPVELHWNPNYLVNVTNYFEQKKFVIYFNAEYDLIVQVLDVFLDIEIYKYEGNKKYFFLNERIQSCDVLRKSGISKLQYFSQKILKILRDHTNGFVCVHEKGHYYYRDIEFNYNQLSRFLPKGRYRAGLYTYDKKKKPLTQIHNYTISFDVSLE
ncbi:hypothetical protein ACFFRR_002097 [Megaselia abdita]